MDKINPAPKTFFELKANSIDGQLVEFKQFKDKPTLVINVASQCGYADSNYSAMVKLQDEYKDNLNILCFPCNQFGKLEFGSNDEVKEFVSRKYQRNFILFDKLDVNGVNAQPVYKWLKSQKGGDIKWNFEKFLLDKNGKIVKRFGSAWTDDVNREITQVMS